MSALWLALAVVAATSLSGGPRLGGPVQMKGGTLAVALRVRSAFVRPGRPVSAPVDGRVTWVASAGRVADGALLAVEVGGAAGLPSRPRGAVTARAARSARAARAAGSARAARAARAAGSAPGTPGAPGGTPSPPGTPLAPGATTARRPAGRSAAPWRRALVAWLCVRPACATAARIANGAAVSARVAAPPRGDRPARGVGERVAVRATGPGWFTPGWDPLAALPPAAYADLTPDALGASAAPAPSVGSSVAAGTPLGVLGAPWDGVWFAAVPEVTADALLARQPSASLSVAWRGHDPVPASVVAAGPPARGWRVLVVASDALGAPPDPPARGSVVLRL